MELLPFAESGLRRKADELAERYVASPGNVGLVVGLLGHVLAQRAGRPGQRLPAAQKSTGSQAVPRARSDLAL